MLMELGIEGIEIEDNVLLLSKADTYGYVCGYSARASRQMKGELRWEFLSGA